MISVIYSLFPILLIPISMILMVRRKSLSWEIKKGKICYNCKDNLNLSDKDLMSRLVDDNCHSKLCTSCLRDIKINSIRNPLFNLKYKFQRYLIDKKSDKLIWYFFGSVFFFIGLDILLMYFGIKLHLSWIYSTINIVFWIFSIYKILYTTTKKTSE